MVKVSSTKTLHLSREDVTRILAEALKSQFSSGSSISVQFDIGEESSGYDDRYATKVLRAVFISGSTEEEIKI